MLATAHTQELSQEYCTLAHHYEQLNNKNKAIELYKKAVELTTHNTQAHTKLASLYYEHNLIADALTHFQHALLDQPHDANILFNIGQCYTKQHQWRAAFEAFQKTLQFNPSHEQAYIQLGLVCEKLKLTQEAIYLYQKAIEINHNSWEAYASLAHLHKERDDLDVAVEYYKRAHQLHPNHIPIMMDLANALHMLDCNQASLELYEQILEKNPHILAALYNFGFTLKKMGHLQRAIEVYNQLLLQKPDYAPAHFSLSSIYLMLGDFERGWQEYEWRWKAYNEEPRAFNKPRWRGEDITGRTLLVHAEQGLGDTLQFIRYLKLIKNKYKYVHIILESQDALIPLLKQQPYIDQIIARNQVPPHFHYHIPLMSLPYLFKTRLETIPTMPAYIQPAASLVATWRTTLAQDKNFKVGICWQGNAHYSTQALRRAVALKSIKLADFAPLFEIPGVSIYSLQQCDGVEQIAHCSFKEKLHTFDEHFDKDYGRFMDTAAVIKNLDLIITVDTSIVHLAGAIGDVPVWVLVPQPPDWRWLLNRTNTPWYPSVRLFRQQKNGEWQSVIAAITQEIYTFIQQKEHPIAITPTAIDTNITNDQRLFFEQLLP